MHTLPTRNSTFRQLKQGALALGILACMGMTTGALAQSGKTKPAPDKHAEPVLIDGIAAVVDTEVITRLDLEQRINHIISTIKKRGGNLPPRAELRKQVLEHMIVERAQLHRAKEAGIRIEDAGLDQTLAKIAEQNKLSLADFRKEVERDGMPYARFREQMRDELAVRRLREREVDNKIQVSDSEIDNFIAAAGASTEQQEINLGHILVRIPENASPEQIAERGKRAQDLYNKLRIGADFAKLALTYSDADDALKGGNVGWRKQDRLPEIFSKAVADMKTGEVSAVIRSPSGFHILKVNGRRNATASSAAMPASVELTHARHILIKVNQLVSADEAKRKLLGLKQRLENKAAKFEDLARLFSNDLSANKGGDLGWIYPGDTVPEFERAMNALKPGQISAPIESPFGFHLIEVLARKTDTVSPERKRMAAKQAIRMRKTEEATEDWLRQVRDSAYVEYRLDEK